MNGVSVVIPVKNGASLVARTLHSVWAQHLPLDIEVIVVDDRSTDDSIAVIQQMAHGRALTIVDGGGRGAAAALNIGVKHARYPIIFQVDQDVVLGANWMSCLMSALNEPGVAAAQGHYRFDREGPLLSRVMGLDLEDRYAALHLDTDHVCTGNTAYLASALAAVGPFDENMGYGYDNDISYRLRSAGYRLVYCKAASSVHRWREGLYGYLRQQYGFGYGRLDLVVKHPTRIAGDSVSPMPMMMHPVVLMVAIVALCGVALFEGQLSEACGALASTLVVGLSLERSVAGLRATRSSGDIAGLWFPIVHILRDLAWVCAIVVWGGRRLSLVPTKPSHSMKSRVDSTDSQQQRVTIPAGIRTLLVIPARNEAANLPFVISESRELMPLVDILVVSDGSTDDTVAVARALGVRWIDLRVGMGVGAAVRVGLRYAERQGFGVVVRLDGDGQHEPRGIPQLISPILDAGVDVVFANRPLPTGSGWASINAISKSALRSCLSAMTRQRVADPTSGFYAMGPRAIHLLAEQHPNGYPEPELRLMLSRTELRTADVAVSSRHRLSGRTSLTPGRLLNAAARVAMAFCVVPFRRDKAERAID